MDRSVTKSVTQAALIGIEGRKVRIKSHGTVWIAGTSVDVAVDLRGKIGVVRGFDPEDLAEPDMPWIPVYVPPNNFHSQDGELIDEELFVWLLPDEIEIA